MRYYQRHFPLATARPVKPVPASEIDVQCDDYLARLRGYAMPGPTRATDKAVLAALCHRCRLDQSIIFRASERELAEVANKAKNTVSKALNRLSVSYAEICRPAFIIRHQRAEEFGAGKYELLWDALPPRDVKSGGTETPEELKVSKSRDLPIAALATGDRSHDAFAAKRRCTADTEADQRAADSISASSFDVWSWLLDHPDAKVKEVEQGTGMSPRTVYRALASLASLTMVVKDDETKCWHAVTSRVGCDADLDPVALHAGTVGRTAKKKRRHELERVIYEEMLAERLSEETAWQAEFEALPTEQRAAYEAEQEARFKAADEELLAKRKAAQAEWDAERQRRRTAPERTTTLDELTLDLDEYDGLWQS